MQIWTEGKCVLSNVSIADNFWNRFKGLMGKKDIGNIDGLLLLKCSCVHCFFMRFTIDVIYLSSDFTIVGMETIKPWRLGKIYKNAKHTLEINKGTKELFKVGQKIELKRIMGGDKMKEEFEVNDEMDQEPSDNEQKALSGGAGNENEKDDILSLRNGSDPLETKLKKNMFGYTKSSVEDYVNQLNVSSTQMQSSLEKQIKSLTIECSKLANENSVLREQLVKVDNERSSAQHELEAALNAKSEAEQKAMDSANNLQELKGKMEEYETVSLEDMVPKEDYLNKDAELQSAINRITQQADQLKQYSSQLESANKELERIRSIGGDTTAVSEEVEKLTEQIKELRLYNENLKAQLIEDQKQHEEAEKAMNSLKASKDALDETIRNQRKELLKMHTEKENLENMYQDKMNLIDELNTEIDNNKNQLEECTKKAAEDLSIKEEEVRKAVQAKEMIEQNYAKLYDQYNKSVAQIEILTSEKDAISELLVQYQAKEQEYAFLRNKNEENKRVIEDCEQNLNSLLEEMDNQLKMFTQFIETHEEDKNLICSLMKEKSEIQVQNVELREKIESLTQQLTSLERESLRLNSQITNMKVPVQITEDDLTEFTKDALPFLSDESPSNPSFSKAVEKASEITKIYTLKTAGFKKVSEA